MNAVTAKFVSIGALLGGLVQGIPCVIDCASGTSSGFYQFFPGDAVVDKIGGGRGADMVLGLLEQTGNPVYFSAAAGTYSALPSVVHTGSGPAVTAALVPGTSGPADYHHHKITITQPGANGIAQFSAAYDFAGSTVIDTFPVPVESPATLVGTAPITPAVLALVTAETLVFDQPASKTLTFPAGSLAAAPAGLYAAAASVAAPVTVLAAAKLAPGKTAMLANPRRVRITTAGLTPSDAPASATITGTDYTGAAQSEVLVLAQTAASASSAKAYASPVSVVYLAADGTGATLAIGYEDAYASVAELITEINALAIAAPLTVTAADAQASDGHHLSLFTNLLTSGAGGTGLSAVLTLDASAGTAATLLGFVNNETATGLAATFAPPWTNVVWTFPASTYGADVYELSCAGPEPSISAITAAMTVARTAWKTSPFGFFAVTSHPSSAANAVGLQAACTALVNAWRADSSCPVACFTGTPFHVMSPVRATNDANITTNDTAIQNAFNGAPAALDSVGGDDCFVTGDPSLRGGSYRRSAVFAMAVKAATLTKLGSNLAEGTVQGVSMRGPDLLSYTRDESAAVVKLGPTGPGQTGLGFCVLTSTPTAPIAAKFAGGITRAGNGSLYRFCGTVFVALYISQNCYLFGFGWVGQQWETSKVPATLGRLTQHVASTQAALVKRALADVLTPDDKPPSVSSLDVTIDNSGNFESLGIVPLIPVFLPLGEVQQVQMTIIASANGTGSTTGLSP